MSINPFNEQTIPLAEAARRLPRLRAGRPVSPATLWRWASHGLRGVKLETAKIGITTVTSVQALGRFFAALNGETAPLVPAGPPAADLAARELDRLGI